MSEQHWLRKFAALQRQGRTVILPSADSFEAVADELQSLQSKLDTIRDDTIRECWGAITAHIQLGQLQGNGCDDTAQRNGMILATNILSQKLEPKP